MATEQLEGKGEDKRIKIKIDQGLGLDQDLESNKLGFGLVKIYDLICQDKDLIRQDDIDRIDIGLMGFGYGLTGDGMGHGLSCAWERKRK